MVLSKEDIESFQKKILSFAQKNYRVFQWRNTVDPYRILVSEIMLQQTQTERVVSKYTEWLDRFPDISSLALASTAEVLEQWNGLGYNRRARFLQQTAKIIHDVYHDVFPKNAEELDALPGIGPYTARAVACFAFGSNEIFIETNIRTVFITEFFSNNNGGTEQKIPDEALLSLIAQTRYEKDIRLWYYALMDYGASLKRQMPNPNRKSASYTKQSSFTGSSRQARGAIIRALSKRNAKGTYKKLTSAQISRSEKIELHRIETAAQKLIQEKMIIMQNGRLSLA